jgi:hypothetical protein
MEFIPFLAYLPVLAEAAGKVATEECDRKCLRSWREVEKRLFFNGVYGNRAWSSIKNREQLSVVILPHLAEAGFAVCYQAVSRAETALNIFSAHFPVKHGLFHENL